MTNVAGTPKTFVFEVGPITHYASTQGEVGRYERQLKNDIDRLIRGYYRVGRRSKAVRSRIEEAA